MITLFVSFLVYSALIFLIGDAIGSKRGHAAGFKKGEEAGRIYERQGRVKLTIVGDDGAA